MIDNILTGILPSLEHFRLLSYWVAFFAALLETTLVVGLLLPGSTILLLLGALSANNHLDFGDLWWFAVMGAILGDNINYWLGQRFGRKWADTGFWLITPELMQRTHQFFGRYGAHSVFLARFIPSLKEIAPFVAGSAGMSRRTFMFWNILGAIGWGFQWIGCGYLFAQSLYLAKVWMSRAGILVVTAVVLWLILWAAWRFTLKHGIEVWRILSSLVHTLWQAVGRNKYIQHIKENHPALSRFLVKRIDRSQFTGLPLSILFLTFVYVLALFSGVIEDLITSDPIVIIDHMMAQLIAAIRTPELVMPFLWITSLGESVVVGILMLVACVVLGMIGRKFAILGLLISTGGASVFCMLSKLAFQRPRPAEAILLEATYSFPSGHATEAAAFYGFIGYLLVRSVTTWVVRVRLIFAFLGLIILIGASRIVLGVHYLSDVWAGYLVGLLWLIVGISLTEWLSSKGYLNWSRTISQPQKWLIIVSLILSVTGVGIFAAMRPVPDYTPQQIQPTQVDSPFAGYIRSHNLVYAVTPFGTNEQPLSFAVSASDADQLSALLKQSGWSVADKPSPANLLRLAQQGQAYHSAPIPPAFWNNQFNDFTFERAIPTSSGMGSVTLTVQIWKTSFQIGKQQIFVGIAKEFDSVRWGVIHHFLPDVDSSADKFIQMMRSSDKSLTVCQSDLIPAEVGQFLMGDPFFTRGKIWYVNLNADQQALTNNLCAEGQLK